MCFCCVLRAQWSSASDTSEERFCASQSKRGCVKTRASKRERSVQTRERERALVKPSFLLIMGEMRISVVLSVVE